MSPRKIVIEKKYYFGDNPEYPNFSDGTYIDLILCLPLHLENIEEQAESIKILFETREIEIFPGWEGHKVYINDQEIGKLKDPPGPNSPELFEIELSREDFETILAESKNFGLEIRLDAKRNSPELWEAGLFHSRQSQDVLVS